MKAVKHVCVCVCACVCSCVCSVCMFLLVSLFSTAPARLPILDVPRATALWPVNVRQSQSVLWARLSPALTEAAVLHLQTVPAPWFD